MKKSLKASLKMPKVLNSLCFGDLIQVDWLDASEATGKLERRCFDTPVRSVGFFLGVKGKRTRHIVIAKEVIDVAKAYHYNVIPINMIESVSVHAKNALDPETKRILKKFVKQTMPNLREKDGWAYAEGKNKKRLH